MDIVLGSGTKRSAFNSNTSTWETQSDSDGVIINRGAVTGDEDVSERQRNTVADQGSPSRASADEPNPRQETDDDVDMEGRAVVSAPANLAVRPRLPQESRSDSNLPAMAFPSVPGPSKSTVVVRDVAYSTYYAFLYYVRRACYDGRGRA